MWFSHGAPANMITYQSIFGPSVEFGHDCSGILLRREISRRHCLRLMR